MSSPLFRKEAVDHQKEKLLGDVLLFQPLSFKILTGSLAGIALLILLFLFTGSYARKETVQGFLIPDKGIAKIYAPQWGTISQVYVQEGQRVVAGQKLFNLVAERSLEGGNNVDNVVLKELDHTLTDLQHRIQGQESINESDLLRLKKQRMSLEAQVHQITEGLKLQTERVKISESRVAKLKTLSKSGYLSEIDYQKIYEDYLTQQQQQQELIRSQINAKAELMKIQSELSQFPTLAKSRILDLENASSETKQRVAEVKGRKGSEVRAPIDGVVDALMAKPGQFQGQIQQTQPLLAIIPSYTKMQAQLWVPTRAMGFIKPGQTVRIRYAAFPYQRYGVYGGKIDSISQHILNPNELDIPLEIKEPVYKVVVNLEEQTIQAYGKKMPLQAGMVIEADVILDKQSLIRWILDPIYTLKGKV